MYRNSQKKIPCTVYRGTSNMQSHCVFFKEHAKPLCSCLFCIN
jgi:hypothetical protein